MFKFSKRYSTLNIEANVDFEDNVAIIKDNSGTGKTFLFKIIASHCAVNHIKYTLFNYNHKDVSLSTFKQGVSDADVVIMDNADLYMTPELFEYLKKCGKQVILSIKQLHNLTTYENCGFYKVKYVNNALKTVRKNYDIVI